MFSTNTKTVNGIENVGIFIFSPKIVIDKVLEWHGVMVNTKVGTVKAPNLEHPT